MSIKKSHSTNNYGIFEIERHFHVYDNWFGAAVTPSGETHVADRLGAGVNAFQLDAGNNTWGAWVQILGSSDTPARTSNVYFDPHEVVITATERTATYFVQFSQGTSGAAGLSAGTYSEFVYSADTNKYTGIINVKTRRAAVGTKLWARCLCPGQNTATMNFYIGIHEYEK